MKTMIRWCFLIALICALSAVHSQQIPQKRAVSDGPEKIQLTDTLIAKDKTQRQTKKHRTTTPRPLGFFGTIWKLITEQVNDTKSAYDQISGLLGNQFSDSQPRPTKPPPITDNSTTTTPAPPKVSRQEFYNILRRNIIGLRRLYNLEVREALADSRKNIREYQKEFHRELYKQFRD